MSCGTSKQVIYIHMYTRNTIPFFRFERAILLLTFKGHDVLAGVRARMERHLQSAVLPVSGLALKDISWVFYIGSLVHVHYLCCTIYVAAFFARSCQVLSYRSVLPLSVEGTGFDLYKLNVERVAFC